MATTSSMWRPRCSRAWGSSRPTGWTDACWGHSPADAVGLRGEPMDVWYLVAVYIHITTVAVWLGAMLFEDPDSDRFMSRIVQRIRGIGWVSLLILIATGVYMLHARGVGLADVVSGR